MRKTLIIVLVSLISLLELFWCGYKLGESRKTESYLLKVTNNKTGANSVSKIPIKDPWSITAPNFSIKTEKSEGIIKITIEMNTQEKNQPEELPFLDEPPEQPPLPEQLLTKLKMYAMLFNSERTLTSINKGS